MTSSPVRWFLIRSILSAIAATSMGSPQDLATFRVGVAEVRVDVQVTDGKKLIAGLGVGDFEVYDDEKLQSLTRFGRESDPIALVILLDVSGSMKRYVKQMATTAQSALKELMSDDRVSVLIFAKETETLSEFTSKLNEVERDIDVGVEQHSLPVGTAIYNAVIQASNSLRDFAQKTPNVRRSVLILTDNESLNYQITEKDVLSSLFSADAVLNAIVTSKTSRPKPRKLGEYRNPDFIPTDIFKVAEETGGEAYKVERADRVFPIMMERLRNRYSLVYKAPPGVPGEFRKIRVVLTPDAKRKYPGATVRARSGYYTAS